jgi:nickel-dependent lactate racemase
MIVRLAYGTTGLDVRFPDTAAVTVVEPVFVPAESDQAGAIAAAMLAPIGSPPLAARVKPGGPVGVVFSDITRPAPNRLMIPAILAELAAAGIPRERITLFNATGTHRPNTPAEVAGMLGAEVAAAYRIVQNDARAAGRHARVGATSSGNEVLILREFLDCGTRILTGFIEPHFFAGYSGGGKAIMPGLAHLDTVMRNHGAANMDSPLAQWGILEGNPLRAEIDEAMALAAPDFLVNVALNRDKAVTRCFAGDPAAAYRAGVAYVHGTALVPVDAPFDIVVTTNSGWPLDLNLYQSVKGISAAARIVKPGGAIVIAAECRDGVPDHGSFGRLLREARSPDELLARLRAPGFTMDDQWQAHILALILTRAEVHVHAGGLTPDQVVAAMLVPCPSVEKRVMELLERYGPHARVCVLPEGPQTIPFVAAGKD